MAEEKETEDDIKVLADGAIVKNGRLLTEGDTEAGKRIYARRRLGGQPRDCRATGSFARGASDPGLQNRTPRIRPVRALRDSRRLQRCCGKVRRRRTANRRRKRSHEARHTQHASTPSGRRARKGRAHQTFQQQPWRGRQTQAYAQAGRPARSRAPRCSPRHGGTASVSGRVVGVGTKGERAESTIEVDKVRRTRR